MSATSPHHSSEGAGELRWEAGGAGVGESGGHSEILDPEPGHGALARLAPLRQAGGQLPGRLLPGGASPMVQAAAAAAGGFVAGAAMLGLVHRRQRRGSALRPSRQARRIALRGGQGAGPGGELLQIVGTRSLLVDVHLLAAPGGER